MKCIALAILAMLLTAGLAFAQQAPSTAPEMPYAFPATVGAGSAMVIGRNQARRRIEFHNPSATCTVSVCPTISRSTGAALTCTLNGAGSITLLPYAFFRFDGSPGNALVPTSWNAIASGGGCPLTVTEYE